MQKGSFGDRDAGPLLTAGGWLLLGPLSEVADSKAVLRATSHKFSFDPRTMHKGTLQLQA